KPAAEAAPSDLAIIGRYVLTPDVFPILAETPPDHRGEIQITDALRRLRERRPLYAGRFTGRRDDTAEEIGFLKATREMGPARPGRGLPCVSQDGDLSRGGPSLLASGALCYNSPYFSPLSTASIP